LTSEWPEVVPQWVPAFFGDSDLQLKYVQRTTYSSLAYELYSQARRRYLDACDLLDVRDALVGRLETAELPPMPFLPRSYRKIAASFRYRACRPGGLWRRPDDETEQARLDWEAFFRREADEIVAIDESARLVLSAATEGEARAAGVDGSLVEWLARRYGEFTLRRRGGRSFEPPVTGSRVRPNPPD
jgi:hypothetical protein